MAKKGVIEYKILNFELISQKYICQIPPTMQMGENDTQVHRPSAIATKTRWKQSKLILETQTDQCDLILNYCQWSFIPIPPKVPIPRPAYLSHLKN